MNFCSKILSAGFLIMPGLKYKFAANLSDVSEWLDTFDSETIRGLRINRSLFGWMQANMQSIGPWMPSGLVWFQTSKPQGTAQSTTEWVNDRSIPNPAPESMPPNNHTTSVYLPLELRLSHFKLQIRQMFRGILDWTLIVSSQIFPKGYTSKYSVTIFKLQNLFNDFSLTLNVSGRGKFIWKNINSIESLVLEIPTTDASSTTWWWSVSCKH